MLNNYLFQKNSLKRFALSKTLNYVCNVKSKNLNNYTLSYLYYETNKRRKGSDSR